MKKILILFVLSHFSLIQADEKKSTSETGATVQSNLSAELQNGKKKASEASKANGASTASTASKARTHSN